MQGNQQTFPPIARSPDARRAQTVRAVIGEVGLSQNKQTREIRHEVIVNPQPAHRIVNRRINPHRRLIGILVRDLVIDVEEIAVALAHTSLRQTANRVRKIEIHSKPGCTNPTTLITDSLGRP